MSKRFFKFAVVAVCLAIGIYFFVFLLILILIHFYGQSDRVYNADAIVVLAGQDYRIEHAANLWNKDVAPYIVCNGGVVKGKLLAEECRQHLISLNIPDEVIVQEIERLSTEEHALYLKPIMDQRDWSSVVIVSSDYHLFRSDLIFHQYDSTTYSSPVRNPDFDFFSYAGHLFREVIAVQWHVFKTVLGLEYTRVDSH